MTNETPQFYLFDIDGTVAFRRGHVDWTDPGSVARGTYLDRRCTPVLRDLLNAGHRVEFLTARRRSTHGVTVRQLAAGLDLPDDQVVVHCYPDRPWSMIGVVIHKADVLADLQPSGGYIGNEPGDQVAATCAGVPYTDRFDFFAPRYGARFSPHREEEAVA